MTAPDRPVSLLLVDDDAALRDITARALRNKGYAVETAENGKAALALALAAPPDVVVSDIMMPVMDGVALLHRLREEPRLRDAHVILLTAKDRAVDVVEGFEATADDYVTKPFRVAELMARIQAGARLKRAQDELRETNARLREVLEHRAELLGVAAHEIRNPINVITTYLPLLGKGIVDDATIQSVCLRRARNLVSLVDNLLDFAKIDAGLIRLSLEEVNFSLAAREACELYRPVAQERGIALECRCAGDLAAVADHDRLVEVLNTLLGNCVRLAAPGGRVMAEAGRDGCMILFRITGLATRNPAVLATLFEVPQNPKAISSGFDMSALLGFAIVRKLTELMTGTVLARQDPDSGLILELRLPAQPGGCTPKPS